MSETPNPNFFLSRTACLLERLEKERDVAPSIQSFAETVANKVNCNKNWCTDNSKASGKNVNIPEADLDALLGDLAELLNDDTFDVHKSLGREKPENDPKEKEKVIGAAKRKAAKTKRQPIASTCQSLQWSPLKNQSDKNNPWAQPKEGYTLLKDAYPSFFKDDGKGNNDSPQQASRTFSQTIRKRGRRPKTSQAVPLNGSTTPNSTLNQSKVMNHENVIQLDAKCLFPGSANGKDTEQNVLYRLHEEKILKFMFTLVPDPKRLPATPEVLKKGIDKSIELGYRPILPRPQATQLKSAECVGIQRRFVLPYVQKLATNNVERQAVQNASYSNVDLNSISRILTPLANSTINPSLAVSANKQSPSKEVKPAVTSLCVMKKPNLSSAKETVEKVQSVNKRLFSSKKPASRCEKPDEFVIVSKFLSSKSNLKIDSSNQIESEVLSESEAENEAQPQIHTNHNCCTETEKQTSKRGSYKPEKNLFNFSLTKKISNRTDRDYSMYYRNLNQANTKQKKNSEKEVVNFELRIYPDVEIKEGTVKPAKKTYRENRARKTASFRKVECPPNCNCWKDDETSDSETVLKNIHGVTSRRRIVPTLVRNTGETKSSGCNQFKMSCLASGAIEETRVLEVAENDDDCKSSSDDEVNLKRVGRKRPRLESELSSDDSDSDISVEIGAKNFSPSDSVKIIADFSSENEEDDLQIENLVSPEKQLSINERMIPQLGEGAPLTRNEDERSQLHMQNSDSNSIDSSSSAQHCVSQSENHSSINERMIPQLGEDAPLTRNEDERSQLHMRNSENTSIDSSSSAQHCVSQSENEALGEDAEDSCDSEDDEQEQIFSTSRLGHSQNPVFASPFSDSDDELVPTDRNSPYQQMPVEEPVLVIENKGGDATVVESNTVAITDESESGSVPENSDEAYFSDHSSEVLRNFATESSLNSSSTAKSSKIRLLKQRASLFSQKQLRVRRRLNAFS